MKTIEYVPKPTLKFRKWNWFGFGFVAGCASPIIIILIAEAALWIVSNIK